MLTPYIQFDSGGKWEGVGIASSPDPIQGQEALPVPLPENAVACTQEQYEAAGPWTTLVSGAIVVGTPPIESAPIAYVPNWLVRERLQDAGKWDAAVGAMSPAQQLQFATLQLGIDPADETVIALLTAIDVPDPAAILAPQA